MSVIFERCYFNRHLNEVRETAMPRSRKANQVERTAGAKA